MKLNQRNNRVTTPFGELQLDVDNLFDQVFGRDRAAGESGEQAVWTPRVSVTESDSAYGMLVELPGVNPSKVSLEIKDNRLEIRGNKEVGELPEGVKKIRDERRLGEFSRSFEFTQQIDTEQIEAEFKHGVLRINLPKAATVVPRKIDIKVG